MTYDIAARRTRRRLMILKMLQLAMEEMREEDALAGCQMEILITLTREYGARLKITEEEIVQVLTTPLACLFEIDQPEKTPEVFPKAKCPKCGHDDIYGDSYNRSPWWSCKTCGNSWPMSSIDRLRNSHMSESEKAKRSMEELQRCLDQVHREVEEQGMQVVVTWYDEYGGPQSVRLIKDVDKISIGVKQ